MLPLKSLPLVHTQDYVTSQMQENVRKTLEPVVQTPLLDGNWIQSVVLSGAGGEVRISHKLGRPYRGYIVTRVICPSPPSGGAGLVINEQVGANPNPALYLVLQYVGAAVSMDIWIF